MRPKQQIERLSDSIRSDCALGSLLAATLVFCAAAPPEGRTEGALDPVVGNNVVGCTRADIALALLAAVEQHDDGRIAQHLADGSCSHFPALEYAPIRTYREGASGLFDVLYVKAFHLIDMYIIVER